MDRLITGGCLVFVGVVFLIALLASPQSGGFVFNLAMSLLFSGPPILLGSWLLNRYAKSKGEAKQARITALEKEVLRLAERKEGALTLSEIVAETSLSSAEAETLLQDFVSRGIAGMRTSETGALHYEFFDIPHREEPVRLIPPPNRLTE